MQLALRTRERSIERVRDLLAPEFLVFVISGTIYSRTYTKAAVTINLPIQVFNPVFSRYRFNPPLGPPLVRIGPAATLDTTYSSVFPVPPPPPPTPPSPYQIGPFTLPVGTNSIPIIPTSFLVQLVTILADKANLGTIWISSAKNTPAGAGFPLGAGAAKDEGELSSTRLVDLSSIYLIGENAADKVHIDYTR